MELRSIASIYSGIYSCTISNGDGSYSPAVASAVFLVIRSDHKEQVNPNYISWCLNQSTTQNYLLSISRVNDIPSINKKIDRLEDELKVIQGQIQKKTDAKLSNRGFRKFHE